MNISNVIAKEPNINNVQTRERKTVSVTELLLVHEPQRFGDICIIFVIFELRRNFVQSFFYSEKKSLPIHSIINTAAKYFHCVCMSNMLTPSTSFFVPCERKSISQNYWDKLAMRKMNRKHNNIFGYTRVPKPK